MKSKLIIDERGTKMWRLPNGSFHREDGPAIEDTQGYKAWWINGELHREDGPAFERNDGYKYWYLKGISYSEKEYKQEIRSRKLKQLYNIQYSEKEYKSKMRSIKLKKLI